MIFLRKGWLEFSVNRCKVVRNTPLSGASTSLAVLEYFHESTVVLQGKYWSTVKEVLRD